MRSAAAGGSAAAMSQGGSSSAGMWRRAPATLNRALQPVVVAPTPLEVAPPAVVDEVTNLPLVMRPYCKDLRLVAFTCKWTKNRGRRFFKCPRYNELEENRCGFYMFQDKYEHYLETKGYLEHCRTNAEMDGVHEVEAIEQVREWSDDTTIGKIHFRPLGFVRQWSDDTTIGCIPSSFDSDSSAGHGFFTRIK